MITKPTHYWRTSKEWSDWLGREGTVVVSTVIRVASPELSSSTPYSLAVVEFGDQRRELMGVGHQVFEPGQKVRCVLRKFGKPDTTGIVPYGIKIEKLER